MLRVNLNRFSIVINSLLEIFLFSVSKSPIMIKISFGWVDFNCFCEINDSIFKVILSVIRNSSVIIGISIIAVNFNRLWVVNYGLVEVSQFIVGEPSVKKRFKMRRKYLQGFCVVFDCLLKVPFLSGFKSHLVKLFGLLILRIALFCVWFLRGFQTVKLLNLFWAAISELLTHFCFCCAVNLSVCFGGEALLLNVRGPHRAVKAAVRAISFCLRIFLPWLVLLLARRVSLLRNQLRVVNLHEILIFSRV